MAAHGPDVISANSFRPPPFERPRRNDIVPKDRPTSPKAAVVVPANRYSNVDDETAKNVYGRTLFRRVALDRRVRYFVAFNSLDDVRR